MASLDPTRSTPCSPCRNVLNPADITEVAGMTLHWSDVLSVVKSTAYGLVIDVFGTCETAVAETTYTLRKVHLLLPSEHRWDDRSSPLEVQFIHDADRHERLLLAVMFHEGEPGPAVGSAIASILLKQEAVRFIDLIPLSRRFYVHEIQDDGLGISHREIHMIHATEMAVSSAQMTELRARASPH